MSEKLNWDPPSWSARAARADLRGAKLYLSDITGTDFTDARTSDSTEIMASVGMAGEWPTSGRQLTHAEIQQLTGRPVEVSKRDPLRGFGK